MGCTEIVDVSVKHQVDGNSEWCAEAYMETDYSDIDVLDFEQEIDKYMTFKSTHKERLN